MSTTPLTPDAAQAAISGRLRLLPVEARSIEGCMGATLRQDLHAERDNPPFDRVCMDGIAVASAQLAQGVRTFRLAGTQTAGMPPLSLPPGATAIEIMTGAVLPPAADCVIPMEEYDLADGVVTLHTQTHADAYTNIQRRGVDGPAGVCILRAGVQLGAPEIAIVASSGLARIAVTRAPAIAVVSTGDELVPPGEPVAAHQIRRSNAYSIVAALRNRGFDNLSDDHIPDDRDLLRARLADKLDRHDVVVLSGGVSQGTHDFVPEVLKGLGVQEVFHEIAQRPGMPMWFGIGPAGQAVFGLPGNPVSTLICLIRYVLPALREMTGTVAPEATRVALASPVRFRRPLTYFLPVSVASDGEGRLIATPQPPNGPGDFVALSRSNGFVELPPRSDDFPAGFVADLYRW